MGEHSISGTAQIEVSAHHTHEPAIAPKEAIVTRAERILSGDIRPDDYLKPPPEVIAWVEQHSVSAKLSPEELRWTLDNSALHYLHAGREIACWRTEKGVIVFAVGSAEVSEVLRSLAPEQRSKLIIEYP